MPEEGGDQTRPPWELVWQDQFDGGDLHQRWIPAEGTGAGGWGNREEQTHVDSSEALRIEDGLLVITAHRGTDGCSASCEPWRRNSRRA